MKRHGHEWRMANRQEVQCDFGRGPRGQDRRRVAVTSTRGKQRLADLALIGFPEARNDLRGIVRGTFRAGARNSDSVH